MRDRPGESPIERLRTGRTGCACTRGSRRRAGAYSFSLHLRRTLLAERSHTFSVIARPTGAVLKDGLVLEELRESARHRRVESLLCEGECFGRAASQRLCELVPLRRELGVRPYAGYQADAQSLVRRDGFAGQDHVERPAPADHSWKEERRAGVRHEPDAAPRRAEARGGCCDADVACDRETKARARG